MVTTTKTTAGERVEMEKRKGKCKMFKGDGERERMGTGAGAGPQSQSLFWALAWVRARVCFICTYMASVVSMCLNTHLFIQIWPTAAATATAAGETIKQVGRQVLK